MNAPECRSIKERLVAAGPEGLGEAERDHLLTCDTCFAAFESAHVRPLARLARALPEPRPLPPFPAAALETARAAERRTFIARLRRLLLPAPRLAPALAALLLLLYLAGGPGLHNPAGEREGSSRSFPFPDTLVPPFAAAPCDDVERLAPLLSNGNGGTLASLVPGPDPYPDTLVPDDAPEEPMSL